MDGLTRFNAPVQVKTFLNRLLGLRVEVQNAIFDRFQVREDLVKDFTARARRFFCLRWSQELRLHTSSMYTRLLFFLLSGAAHRGGGDGERVRSV